MAKQRMGKLIEWDDYGNPVPIYRTPYTKTQVKALQDAALVVPYEPQHDPQTHELLPGEERYVGMTNGEVGALRLIESHASGDIEATKYVLDRQLGRPTQETHNVNVNVNYLDFLSQCAIEDTIEQTQTQTTSLSLNDDDDDDSNAIDFTLPCFEEVFDPNDPLSGL